MDWNSHIANTAHLDKVVDAPASHDVVVLPVAKKCNSIGAKLFNM
jgi:hypothetical protein